MDLSSFFFWSSWSQPETSLVSSFPRMSLQSILRECLQAGLPSGLPSTAPPPVCVSAAVGMLAVWTTPKKKKISLEDHWGGDSLPRSAAATPMIGARQHQLSLSSCSSLPAHGPPRSHTWPRTPTTPLHATTLHSHLLPVHTPAPCSHLYFGYRQPVPGALLGFASAAAKDRATLHIPHTPWQSIQKSFGCTPLFPSPKSVRLWGVHRHRTGWRPIGVPFRSTLQTV